MTTDNPFEEMSRLVAEMDRRFDELRSSWWGADASRDESGMLAPAGDATEGSRPFAPLRGMAPWRGMGGLRGALRLDFDEEAGEYVAIVDLPGFETEEIDLRLTDGVLSIDAVHEVETAEHARSRRFSERVSIPGTVDEAAVEASYRNGVLEVRLPTTVDESGHRIEIAE